MRRIEITPKRGILFLLFILLIAYSLFQARFIILGPHIEVAYPTDGAVIDAPIYTMYGTAKNIAYISLNDRPIFIDPQGNFSEKLIAPAGLGIITIRARDRFGRQTERTIRVVNNN